MATSKTQKNTTIDLHHFEWYRRFAGGNPFITMAGMRREAHDVYQQNYAMLQQVQRRLQNE